MYQLVVENVRTLTVRIDITGTLLSEKTYQDVSGL